MYALHRPCCCSCQREDRSITLQKATTELQLFGSLPVSEKSEEADSDEALRQDVHHKPPEKFGGLHGHRLVLVAVRVVLPPESDLVAVDGKNSAIGDRHAVGVAGQIAKDLLRSAKWRFGVDDPFTLEGLLNQLVEPDGIGERRKITKEDQSSFSKRTPEQTQELATKDPAQHLHRQQKAIA